jgi:hypothetical protein
MVLEGLEVEVGFVMGVLVGVVGVLTVRMRVALPVPPAFDAWIVSAYEPPWVGVPEITPDEFRERPAGRPSAEKEVGTFDAWIA